MPVTSSASSIKRWPTADHVLDALHAWAHAQSDTRPELKALGYFGSHARGDAGFGSDLDLVAIVRRSALPFIGRARDWPTDSLPVSVDLLVYTAAEWKSLQDERSRFAATLATETVWVVGQPPRFVPSEPSLPVSRLRGSAAVGSVTYDGPDG